MYVSHSCIKTARHSPRSPIKSNHQFFIVGSLVVALNAATFFPGHVSAFWPFSDHADAAANIFTPGSSTPALQASTNIDPNPDKGLGDIQTSGGRALIAYGGPSGTITDVVGASHSDRISVYVVRKGDTLSDIASMFNVSVNTIIWANDLSSMRDVHPGDTLVILPISGIDHKVVKGDTLKSIAKKYHGDAGEIAQFNGIDEDSLLAIGTTIIVPGGEIVAPPAPTRIPGTTALRAPSRGGGVFLPGYYINPLPSGRVTQGIHGWNGIDIGAARGTPIYAAASGTVVVVRSGGGWNGGYGNYIVIQHNNGTQTLYSHNSSNLVSTGQSVTQGQTIGYVGSSGRSTGTHLHFEVRGAANPLRTCSIGSACSTQ